MHIFFRADASLEIGSGHVVRCLALADELRQHDAQCLFLCREHTGHLLDLIRTRGYEAMGLPPGMEPNDSDLAHAAWLGATWQEDAARTLAAIGENRADWLVVDHYALDARWERAVRPACARIMAIDDLADRSHDCDVLLDPDWLGDDSDARRHQTPAHCLRLLGPQYAIVRPEFAALRPASLKRREHPRRERLLVFMGGGDVHDYTTGAIIAIQQCKRPWARVDVVVGQAYPWRKRLEEALHHMPVAVLHVQTPYMAELLCAADFAVTGGGGVIWEKCVLGVPGVTVIVAQNQSAIARKLCDLGAHRLVACGRNKFSLALRQILDDVQEKEVAQMSCCSARICDGNGLGEIANILIAEGMAKNEGR